MSEGIGALVVPSLSTQMRGLVEYLVRHAEAPGGLPEVAEDLATRYGFGSLAISLIAGVAAFVALTLPRGARGSS